MCDGVMSWSFTFTNKENATLYVIEFISLFDTIIFVRDLHGSVEKVGYSARSITMSAKKEKASLVCFKSSVSDLKMNNVLLRQLSVSASWLTYLVSDLTVLLGRDSIEPTPTNVHSKYLLEGYSSRWLPTFSLLEAPDDFG